MRCSDGGCSTTGVEVDDHNDSLVVLNLTTGQHLLLATHTSVVESDSDTSLADYERTVQTNTDYEAIFLLDRYLSFYKSTIASNDAVNLEDDEELCTFDLAQQKCMNLLEFVDSATVFHALIASPTIHSIVGDAHPADCARLIDTLAARDILPWQRLLVSFGFKEVSERATVVMFYLVAEDRADVGYHTCFTISMPAQPRLLKLPREQLDPGSFCDE